MSFSNVALDTISNEVVVDVVEEYGLVKKFNDEISILGVPEITTKVYELRNWTEWLSSEIFCAFVLGYSKFFSK